MATSDDDEDLKLALALSVQQSPPNHSNHFNADSEVIDLRSDTEEEDDDMRRAIALSLQEIETTSSPGQHGMGRLSPAVSNATTKIRISTPFSPPTSSSTKQAKTPDIPVNDRATMERERLARLGKRKRVSSADQPSKQIANQCCTRDTQAHNIMANLMQCSTLQYPQGAIKRTFAVKYPRTDDITIDEVLQADTINIAVISSFMWDAEWLNQKLNPCVVKQIWIMSAKGQDIQQRWVREMKETGIPNLKLHFPSMAGIIQSMHSKFMLLFGKDKLRMVVPTANMTPIDWGEVKNDWQPGVMENSVFLVDLPRRHDGLVGDRESLTAFGKGLIYFLEKQEVDQKVVDGVLKFDFSQTNHLGFVHAIGGTHKGELQQATGLPGLTKAIRDLKLDDVKAMELDYASASLGAINDALLQRIYLAASGKAFTTTGAVRNVRDLFRIYFPTDEAVQSSIGGPDCGGIISLNKQYYSAATFPRECLRNYDSTRRGMLSHNKLLFARGITEKGEPFAWAYVGSANMSESAWGGQKVLKSGQMSSLNVRNWECGIVMPVPMERLRDMEMGDGEIPPMEVFTGTVEVPFVYPGQRYGDKEPWFRPV